MAMRQVVSERTVTFDPRAKRFRVSIPEEVLVNEPNRERIDYLWERFRSTVNQLCKTRNSILVTKHHSKNIFYNGMDKLCQDFSRRAETILVKFEVEQHDKKKKKKKKKIYALKFVQLNEIPEDCRNAPFFTVDRIREEPQVHAEFVSYDDDHDSNNDSQLVHVQDLSSGVVSSNQAEILQLPQTRMGEILAASTLSQCYDYNDSYVNPPIAAAVLETPVISLERNSSSSSLELLPVLTVL